ncbi:MAG: hypothetical protein WD696_09155 [Bryobacteraceae bacterium]
MRNRIVRGMLGTALLLLTACGSHEAPPEALFPPALGDAWKRTSLTQAPAAEAPEDLARLGVKRIVRAEYAGPGVVHAEIHEMTTSAASLEAVQKWRAQADSVIFHHENYFVRVHWQDANKDAATDFVRALQNHLTRGPTA